MRKQLPGEKGFLAYVRTIAQGGRLPAMQAKLVLRLDADSPSKCRARLRERTTSGVIDASSAPLFAEAIEELYGMWERREQTHVIDTTGTHDWISLPHGAHMRRAHLIGAGK